MEASTRAQLCSTCENSGCTRCRINSRMCWSDGWSASTTFDAPTKSAASGPWFEYYNMEWYGHWWKRCECDICCTPRVRNENLHTLKRLRTTVSICSSRKCNNFAMLTLCAIAGDMATALARGRFSCISVAPGSVACTHMCSVIGKSTLCAFHITSFASRTCNCSLNDTSWCTAALMPLDTASKRPKSPRVPRSSCACLWENQQTKPLRSQ